MDKEYNLPLGGMTFDVNEYISSWESLSDGLSEITGLEPDSFDPCICLRTGMEQIPLVHFSPENAVYMINKWLDWGLPTEGLSAPIDRSIKDCKKEYEEEIELYKTYGGD